ncbi:hypothetical protein MIR68_004035 [Amoeboaphelidium protococcarum]|nr:hypothetical protein MIR68_004035 [Amoeboaphelidium protococcarum]
MIGSSTPSYGLTKAWLGKRHSIKSCIFWTRHGRKDDLDIVKHNFQQGGFGVFFWGCFSKFGFGPLVVVDGTMKGDQYIDVIQTHLLPELDDNAPCHKPKVVMNFMAQNKVPLLPWPPQSPDLNPIENLWAIINQRRQKKYGMPQSKQQLIEQVFEIWNELPLELAETLADSAKRRLSIVLERNGRHTGY